MNDPTNIDSVTDPTKREITSNSAIAVGDSAVAHNTITYINCMFNQAVSNQSNVVDGNVSKSIQRQESPSTSKTEENQDTLVEGFLLAPIPTLKIASEDEEQQFKRGKLIYKPNEGKVIEFLLDDFLAQGSLKSCLFDLTQCGDADRYLSISTGVSYRKNV